MSLQDIQNTNDRSIVIFDGVCNVCNASVNFIIKRDQDAKFLFTPMQSEFGQSLIKKYNLTDVNGDTLVVIKHDKAFVRSDAALAIAKELDGYWPLFTLFHFVPRPIRDFFYSLFAQNRYRLFGKKEACMLPTKEVLSRFIDT